MNRKTMWALGCALVGIAAVPAVAIADGGGSIAGAPAVTYAQLESGDTSTVGSVDANTYGCHSWWLLHVMAGDRLTVNFQGAPNMMEQLYPAGTNDYNLSATNPLPDFRGSEQADAAANGWGQAKYVAPHDGTMPLSFSAPSCGNSSSAVGGYSFSVYELHGLVLSASQETDPETHISTISLSARNGDGQMVTTPLTAELQRPQGHRWLVRANQSLPATFSVYWPENRRNRLQRIKLVVSGAGYWTTAKHMRFMAR